MLGGPTGGVSLANRRVPLQHGPSGLLLLLLPNRPKQIKISFLNLLPFPSSCRCCLVTCLSRIMLIQPALGSSGLHERLRGEDDKCSTGARCAGRSAAAFAFLWRRQVSQRLRNGAHDLGAPQAKPMRGSSKCLANDGAMSAFCSQAAARAPTRQHTSRKAAAYSDGWLA